MIEGYKELRYDTCGYREVGKFGSRDCVREGLHGVEELKSRYHSLHKIYIQHDFLSMVAEIN